MSFLIRALDWFSIFFMDIKIHTIASVERSAMSRAPRILSACPLTARFNSRPHVSLFVTSLRVEGIKVLAKWLIPNPTWAMAVSDCSESSPRFRAGLRALITLDRDEEFGEREAAETHEKEKRFVRKTFPSRRSHFRFPSVKKCFYFLFVFNYFSVNVTRINLLTNKMTWSFL